ncbi:MAG: MBL fold metallo-hydrolase [Clostridia bacterium]|nr:MBL fold metallo-hydrolase [Clostridia bacterium]
MRSLLRPFALIMALLLLCTFGCSHPDVYEPTDAEKQLLREALLSARPDTPDVSGPSLEVVVIDVGQGDSILLVSPEGKTMLVDAGPKDSFERIRQALDVHGVSSLDVVVATHPHADHIGSMAEVLNAYPVGTFVTIPETIGMYAAVDTALVENGCSVCFAEGGTTIPWAGSCTVTVLNPIASYNAEQDELNDRSVVLHVRYGDTAVLLAGDAEELAEKRMLDTFPQSMLRANVLKLGHHGSSSSTGYGFFLAVDPDFAAASCGADNDYGHPHKETLSLLYDTRTAFYCTDTDGTVTFRLDGKAVSVNPS